MTLLYAAQLRQRNEARADRIEDLLTASVETEKGMRAAMARVKALRKR